MQCTLLHRPEQCFVSSGSAGPFKRLSASIHQNIISALWSMLKELNENERKKKFSFKAWTIHRTQWTQTKMQQKKSKKRQNQLLSSIQVSVRKLTSLPKRSQKSKNEQFNLVNGNTVLNVSISWWWWSWWWRWRAHSVQLILECIQCTSSVSVDAFLCASHNVDAASAAWGRSKRTNESLPYKVHFAT